MKMFRPTAAWTAAAFMLLLAAGPVAALPQTIDWRFAGWYGGGAYPMAVPDPTVRGRVYLVSDTCGIWRSEDYGNIWSLKTKGLTSLRVVNLAVSPSDPNVVYAGSEAGVYRSTDAGENWTFLNATAPAITFKRAESYRSLCVHPSRPAEVYAGTGSGEVFVSYDSGASWRTLGTPFGFGSPVGRLEPSPDGAYLFAGSPSGLRRFDVASELWADTALPEGKVYDMVFGAAGVLYVTFGTKVATSADSGVTWRYSTAVPAVGEISRVAVPRAGPSGRLLVACWDGSQGTPLLSADNGATWTSVRRNLAPDPVSNPARSWRDGMENPLSALFDPFDANVIYWTDEGGVWRSDDTASSWNEKVNGAANAVISDLAATPGGSLYAASAQSGLVVSSDGGSRFRALTPKDPADGASQGPVWRVLVDGLRIVATHSPKSGANEVLVSEDGGATFTRARTGLPAAYPSANVVADGKGRARALARDPQDPRRYYLGIDGSDGGGLFVSADGGYTWARPSGQPGSAKVYNALAVDPTDPVRLFWGAVDGGIWRSADRAASWSKVMPSGAVYDLAIASDGRAYAAGDSGGPVLWTSVNQGAYWSVLKTFPDTGICDALTIDPTDPTRIAVSVVRQGGTAPGRVYVSEDRGATWTEISADLPNFSGASSMVFSPEGGTLYLAPDAGGVHRLAAAIDDPIPPTTPSNLQLSVTGDKTVNLTWGASSDNKGVWLYSVLRSGIPVGTSASTVYTDTTASFGSPYTYTVTASDASGNVSPPSNSVSVVLKDTTPPSAPANLRGTSGETVLQAPMDQSVPGASALFDGASQLSVAASTDWSFGAEDFTIDFWVKFDTLGLQTLFSHATSRNDYMRLLWDGSRWTFNAGNRVFAFAGPLSAPDTLAPNTWYHVALVHSGASWSLYRDGVLKVRGIDPDAYPEYTGDLVIGCLDSNDGLRVFNLKGRIDGFRISRGLARWSADFEPVLEAEQPDESTRLLVRASESEEPFRDAGASAHPIVVVGNVRPDPVDYKLEERGQALPAGSRVPTVDLTWDASTDNGGVTGYKVFRNGAPIAAPTGTAYADLRAKPGVLYSYTVKAFDAAGNLSGPGGPKKVALNDTVAPTSPANLTARVTPNLSVDLAWTASTDDVGLDGYEVLRNGTLVAVAPSNSYLDASAAPGATYSYTVRALDAGGNRSGSTSAVPVRVEDVSPPTTPSNLQLSVTGDKTVNLTWGASSDNKGVWLYSVLRSGIPVGTSASTVYTDTTASFGSPYTYTVTASDASGNVSPPSNSVSVVLKDTTPPSAPANLRGTSGETVLQAPMDQSVPGASALFDGASQLSVAASTDWSFGAEDFTIDFWVRFDDLSLQAIFSHADNRERYTCLRWDGRRWQFCSENKVFAYASPLSAPDTLAPNTWYHVALVRSGASWSLYRDGVLKVRGIDPDPYPNHHGNFVVGALDSHDGLRVFNLKGRIDGFRISRGLARWSADFEPVLEAEQPDESVRLLLRASESEEPFRDAGASAHPIVVVGNVRVDPVEYKLEEKGQTLPAGSRVPMIDLNWDASTDNGGVTGYKVFRNGAPIATVTGTAYADLRAKPGVLYSYTVKAFDAAANLSGSGAPAQVTLPPSSTG